MEIRVHHYHHDAEDGVNPRLERIEHYLKTLIVQGEKFMSKDEAKRLDELTNKIVQRFQKLLAAAQDNLTPEEKAEVEADFVTLEALGKDPANPIPPTP